MTKTVVITQSNYLPWRGYFDMLSRADEVILYDSVQYTRRDWRNRNRIKSANGLTWITVPVEVKGRYLQTIDETRVADPRWAEKHIRTITQAYKSTAAFGAIASWLFPALSAAAQELLLTDLNERLLRVIMHQLSIRTTVRRCTTLIARERMARMDPSERLVALCQAAGAQRYLSAPAAKAYLDEKQFSSAGIEVQWMDYGGYPDYPQLWGPFEPNVSIIDLLFNTGTNALRYLKPSAPSSASPVLG